LLSFGGTIILATIQEDDALSGLLDDRCSRSAQLEVIGPLTQGDEQPIESVAPK
jgi:hypothetical protein